MAQMTACEMDTLMAAASARPLCPHGMVLADNVCGPCSKGKPNRPSASDSEQPAVKQGGDIASLIQRLRNTPNWKRESFDHWKDCTSVYDRAPFEAADALAAAQQTIDRMRAKLLDQAREFMLEQRATFQLSDDTYHCNLGLLADFVAHVAGVCKRCHGSTNVTISNYDGNGSDADDQPCPECLDIREAAR